MVLLLIKDVSVHIFFMLVIFPADFLIQEKHYENNLAPTLLPYNSGEIRIFTMPSVFQL